MTPGFCSPTPEGKAVQESPDLLLKAASYPEARGSTNVLGQVPRDLQEPPLT